MATFAISVFVGVIVGVLSGMLGIGGGTIIVPLLRLGYGLQAIQATATSLFTIIPTSIAGVITHVRNRTCLVPVGLAAGLGGACTSPVGVWLASVSPSWLIMLVAAGVIVYSASRMLAKGLRKPKASVRKVDALSQDARGPESKEDAIPPRRRILVGASVGLAAGVLSGYVGVGGGFIMVPLFLAYAGVSMRQASGTSLLAVAILSVPGAATQYLLGNVQVLAGLALAVGSIPGAVLGAQLARRIPDRVLRLIFGGMLMLMAIMLAVNEIVSLGN
ncbi:sulfite exporter TauE/SafE family protein [Denitrobacterium detoxificans]|uniref:sulfite exporter TauE/SafE family protein n=1 Tax=Denitrobacterium detoxificans TaxID=79604 RepID=UPI0026F36C7F|nr:sulfite exporter TauE/SafE family protein [Denitrobacterium detoxificans]MBE6466854.1 sulfite exporter TauE/SafE family protein [Denitrobacterium detoxificans]